MAAGSGFMARNVIFSKDRVSASLADYFLGLQRNQPLRPGCPPFFASWRGKSVASFFALCSVLHIDIGVLSILAVVCKEKAVKSGWLQLAGPQAPRGQRGELWGNCEGEVGDESAAYIPDVPGNILELQIHSEVHIP